MESILFIYLYQYRSNFWFTLVQVLCLIYLGETNKIYWTCMPILAITVIRLWFMLTDREYEITKDILIFKIVYFKMNLESIKRFFIHLYNKCVLCCFHIRKNFLVFSIMIIITSYIHGQFCFGIILSSLFLVTNTNRWDLTQLVS